MKKYKEPLHTLKGYICLFKIEGHRTYRVMTNSSIEAIELHLKTQTSGQKITMKKFFEVDRLTGTLEEFF